MAIYRAKMAFFFRFLTKYSKFVMFLQQIPTWCGKTGCKQCLSRISFSTKKNYAWYGDF